MSPPRPTPRDAQPLVCEDSETIVYFVPGGLVQPPPIPAPYDTDSDTSSIFSQHSASTLSSQDVRGYFTDIGGRMVPCDPELPFFMPQDEQETHRLDHEHVALRLCVGGNYVGPVASHLRRQPGAPRKRVLDIGTQKGSWVQEMATEFPDVDFVSLDVSPMTAHEPRENVIFEVYDLYAGLVEPDASFDVVHVRHMLYKIGDYPALLRDLHRVLRPGGILLAGELENEAYGAAAPDTPLGDAVPRLTRGMALVRGALSAQGVKVGMCRQLASILSDPALFAPGAGTESDAESSSGSSFSDVGSSIYSVPMRSIAAATTMTPLVPGPPSASLSTFSGFIHVTARTYRVPATPWPSYYESPALHEAGRQAFFALRRGWPSLVPLLTTHAGTSFEDARELAHGAVADHFVDPSLKIIINYHTVWAIKA